MRRMLLTLVALAALFSVGSLTNKAEAMTLPAPAGIAAAIAENPMVEQAAYVCRRVWVCGPYGCGWRRNCWWSGPRWRRHWRRW